jgi:hypothetical protein
MANYLNFGPKITKNKLASGNISKCYICCKYFYHHQINRKLQGALMWTRTKNKKVCYMSKPLMIKKGTINIDRLSKYFILFVHSTCLKTIKIIYIEKN